MNKYLIRKSNNSNLVKIYPLFVFICYFTDTDRSIPALVLMLYPYTVMVANWLRNKYYFYRH